MILCRINKIVLIIVVLALILTNIIANAQCAITPYRVNLVDVNKIEAENFCTQQGTQNENTTDNGGGVNVGYIDSGDWISYPISVSDKGDYVFNLRIASLNGGSLNILVDNIQTVSLSVNATGGWQSWKNFQVSVPLEKGEHIIKLQSTSGNWNFNYFSIYKGRILNVPVSEKIIINQVGYEFNGPKKAIYSYSSTNPNTTFEIVDFRNISVFSGRTVLKGAVNGWSTGSYAELDFSDLKLEGEFKILIGNEISNPFVVQKNMYFNKTGTAPINFFNNMRHNNNRDQSLSFFGPRNDAVNVSGGWWDANGDPGKHMSHLSYANHFNPQQIPFVVYSMLSAMENMDYGNSKSLINSEINFGLDYLTRNVDGQGYLYLSVFDDWGGAPNAREICEWGVPGNNAGRTSNYQAAMREGAGIAIASLAKAATSGQTFGASSNFYVQKAEQLYLHLKSAGNGYATKNLEYCNNHQENIIDMYCGLMAATELFKATKKDDYQVDARKYADRLLAMQGANGELYSDDAKNRPFYHAADEGMPIVALNEFLKVDKTKQSQIVSFCSKWLDWNLKISYEVNNPFDYAREYYKPYTSFLGQAKKAFFLPHDNETGYWWQGENARLASMTTALLRAQRIKKDSYAIGTDSVSKLAIAQLDWILGKNPFNLSMMEGYGYKNTPSYLNGTDPTKKKNIVGGICNGITSDLNNENDITFMPYPITSWETWRWVEQWLPHDAWYLMAVSTIGNIQTSSPKDCNNEVGGTAFINSCNLCVGGSTGRNVNDCPTGFDNETQKEDFRIYPNPATTQVCISKSVDWRLLDAFGNNVKNGSSQVVDIQDIPFGLYVLQIQNRSFRLIKK